MQSIVTTSAEETRAMARSLITELAPDRSYARVLALTGELGAGKTTFAQACAAALGVREKVASPTFVILKIYELGKRRLFKHLIHIDCYRLGLPDELLHLGFAELLKDRDAVIVIEWADKMRTLIPQDALWISFAHGRRKEERIIKISYPHEKNSSHR